MLDKHKRVRRIFLLITILISVIFLMSCWGDPSFSIIFANQSENALIISVNDYEVGKVQPDEEITDDAIPMTVTRFNIKAKTIHGDIVFSKTITREQMEKIKSRVYKVTIKEP